MKIIKGSSLNFIPANHENPKNPGALKKILLEKNDLINGRVQMVYWAKIPVGKSFNPHYHEDMEEIFIILRGRTKVTVNGETAEIEKGDTVLIPIKAVHVMENIGDKDVEYIVIGVTLGKDGKTVRA